MRQLTNIYDNFGIIAASIDINEIIGINSIDASCSKDAVFSEIILTGGVKIGIVRSLKDIKTDLGI